jgi:hypothetical protein
MTPHGVEVAVLRIKLVHTVIFWFLSGCVVYALFSGVTGRLMAWTGAALGCVVVEGVVLAAWGCTCPLTLLAERLGAAHGQVADLFLPKWFADRIFPICGVAYGFALFAIVVRMFWQP